MRKKDIPLLPIVLEAVGIGLVAAALIEGVTKNPAMYIAAMGAFLITCGGFLFSKMRKGG